MKENHCPVVLVEDDDAHAEIVRRNLEECGIGFNLLHLNDGQEALDYFYRQGKYSDPKRYPLPGLIILDLRLPKVDGLLLLNVIKSDPDLLRIPTVVLTTSSADEDKARAYAGHANSYLVKPMESSRFTSMIKAMGEYWLSWNLPPGETQHFQRSSHPEKVY
jgi:CheY-like chemotaxis protein